MLTQKKLKENLHYNPKTGEFIWLKAKGSRAAGAIAVCVFHNGYRLIRINNKMYQASRLAWLYVYGYTLENEVDHINRNSLDDRIENLREVSRQCNMRNTGNPKNNTSGVKGVSWDKSQRKWKVRIGINETQKHIGRHADYSEAICHRLAAEQCIGWSGCDSSSPAYKYVRKLIYA